MCSVGPQTRNDHVKIGLVEAELLVFLYSVVATEEGYKNSVSSSAELASFLSAPRNSGLRQAQESQRELRTQT